MFISTIIHVLELATALLVLLLAVRINRCYQEFTVQESTQRELNKAQKTQNARTIAPADGAPQPAAQATSTAILNDYIGGFFEAPTADITAFRAAAPVAAKTAVEREAPAEQTVAESPITESMEELELPVLSEEIDGEIIMVAAEDSDVAESDRVMSDKVVHAMLDEAKLVCAS